MNGSMKRMPSVVPSILALLVPLLAAGACNKDKAKPASTETAATAESGDKAKAGKPPTFVMVTVQPGGVLPTGAVSKLTTVPGVENPNAINSASGLITGSKELHPAFFLAYRPELVRER